jgi:hypothetical protein
MPRKSAAASMISAVDGQPSRLRPPASLNEAERTIFLNLVTACHPSHFRVSDLPMLSRYCEVVALSDHAAGQLRADVMQGRAGHWLAVQGQLVKMMIALARQLRLAPLARQPNNPGRGNGHGHAAVSVYERMRLEDHDQA